MQQESNDLIDKIEILSLPLNFEVDATLNINTVI